METNSDTFEAELARQYTDLFANDPRYANAQSLMGPLTLAYKMTYALSCGMGDSSGEGVKRTCKTLGIKRTYAAIREYLAGNV